MTPLSTLASSTLRLPLHLGLEPLDQLQHVGLGRDLVDPAITAVDGLIDVPDSPGLGFEPVAERIADRCIRSLTLPA